MRSNLLGLVLACTVACFGATNRPTVSGHVVDADGNPVVHATVMVYHAGVKSGYSIYCPSCYADCGKRVFTDAKGDFEIKDLAPDLWFTLLAARDGYVPKFSKRIDPAKDLSVRVKLAAKPASADFSGLVRGRVVDEGGVPISDAVVTPTGLIIMEMNSAGENLGEGSSYGTIDGLQPIAVTNEKGEFEIAYAKPTPKMLLDVEARGMAEKFVVMQTGAERHSVALSEGGTIAGRLMANGKPVGGAQVGLKPKGRSGFGANLKILGEPYQEIRIGTGSDGRFTVSNVPSPVDWYVYAKMDSISELGATSPVEVKVERDRQYVTAGDLVIRPGFRLRGTVVVSDGKPIPEGMHMSVASAESSDSQTVALGGDGHFEFRNLPAGDYQVWASVRGYHEKEVKYGPPSIPVAHDVDGFTTTVYPNVP